MTDTEVETPDRPAAARPTFVVELVDGSTRQVRPAVPDYVRWEKVAHKFGDSHAFTMTAYIVWACLRREGDVTDTFDAWLDRVSWFDTVEDEAPDVGPTSEGRSLA